MSRNGLASRLEDIPGVAAVTVDLEGFGRGIDVRLEPGADEERVIDDMRRLLAAYGLRREASPEVSVGRRRSANKTREIFVKVTPVGSGARVEVANAVVRSFRMVEPDPFSVAQGLADAWCQVMGREPIQVTEISADDHNLALTVVDGEETRSASHAHEGGWHEALVRVMGEVLGSERSPGVKRAAS